MITAGPHSNEIERYVECVILKVCIKYFYLSINIHIKMDKVI